MLRAMEEDAKRAKEESEKKLLQQQQQAAKLRAKMGVDNVAPRLFEPLKRGVAEGEEEEEGGKKKPAPLAEEEEEDDDDPEKLAAKKASPRAVQRLRLAPFFFCAGRTKRKNQSFVLFFFFCSLSPCTLLRVGALVASHVGAGVGYGIAGVRGLRVRGLLLTAVPGCCVRVRG